MVVKAIKQTVGIGIGTFPGCLHGLTVRARQGKTGGLIRKSVLLTSVLAGTVGWTIAVPYNLVAG